MTFAASGGRERGSSQPQALVIDTESDHNTNDTAMRVARMFIDEVFKGRYMSMPAVTEFPNASRLNQLMIVGTIISACTGAA